MIKLLLITDYRDLFYSSTKNPGAGFDTEKLKKHFLKKDMHLIIKNFSEIDFRKDNYKNIFVLYQTSEDPGLYYKDYIEDILLGLKEQSAVLIPDFKFFRAHHNKVFMEILRDLDTNSKVKNITSQHFGTLEDYLHSNKSNQIKVLKSAYTSKSRGVYLLDNNKTNISKIKKASSTFSLQNIKYIYQSVKKFKRHLKISNYRSKFVVQNYVSYIKGDYRIIVYGNKYYTLYRENRINDFRASGSMRFNFNKELPIGILNFAEDIFNSMNVPFIALDIAEKDGEFFLFEFQVISFGQYTFEKSIGYYSKDGADWKFFKEVPDLELEFVNSVNTYINKVNICAR